MPELQPRRRPKRRSSQSIVTAILDAGSALLVESGLAGMTTNEIARRAGISVGSLYQYFPNKHAVCAGIAGRVNERLVLELLEAVSVEGSALDKLDAAISVMCSSSIGSHEVRAALLEHVPRIWDEALIAATERRAGEVIAPLFEELVPDLDAAERAERQRVATFAVRGAVQGMLIQQPELLDREDVSRWLRAMVLAVFRQQ